MTTRFILGALLAALVLPFGPAPAHAQEQARVLQGKDLFGRPMYTVGSNPVNVAATDTLLRAVAEAKAAYEADPSIDNATWYGRLLGYQGLAREAIEVYTAGLKRHPGSAKLLRHRAHRYFNLREFDRSIADGLRSVELYRGKPLERERLGPDYFPSTPDVVQFYLYYHLGHAYFAKKDFEQAATWFGKAREVGDATHDAASTTAGVYWQYLSLARGLRNDEARALLDDYDLTLVDLRDNIEANYYFDGIQLFRDLRDPETYHQAEDSGKAFSTADAMSSGTAYSLANYWLLRGERAKAREFLRIATQVETWSFFARVQAEADWVALFGPQAP
jgi:tetratricopeptide (TPR) repeat protein